MAAGSGRDRDMREESWLGKFGQFDRWSFCLTAARMAGPARNSVYGRAVEPQPAMAWVKRSPKRTANWALAIAHSRGGILHSFSARFKTRNSSFIAASSVGKWPLARTARRSLELSASIAFVVYNSRRTSPGKA